jgi:cell division septation protein DedD
VAHRLRKRSRGVAALIAAGVAVLAIAAAGGATDGFVDPSTTETTVAAGGSVTVPETMHFDGVPAPQGDVVIAIDTTTSMAESLAAAKTDAKALVAQLDPASTRVKIVELRDYSDADVPDGFRTVRSFNNPDVTPDDAIDSLTASTDNSDIDNPAEAYFGLFSSIASDETFNSDAMKYLVVLGDQTGHDTSQGTVNEFCPNSGPTDPAGGLRETAGELEGRGVVLDFITYPDQSNTIGSCHQTTAALTGGRNTFSGGGAGLGKVIAGDIGGSPTQVISPSVSVETVTGIGDFDPSQWITIGGLPDVLDVPPAGADMPFQVTIQVPANAAHGDYSVELTVADGTATRASQVLDFTVGTPLTGLTLTVDQESIPAGIKNVPFSAIPPDRLALGAGTDSSSTELGSTPISSTPISSTPISSTPISSTPISSTPISSTGLLDAPISSTPISSTPLHHVLLSQIALHNTTWDAVLCAPLKGKPLNALTLADVAGNACSRANFQTLTLGQVDLSTTLLKGVRWTSLLLGAVPLAQVPTVGGFSSWKDAINAAGGDGNAIDPSTDTALGVDIAGKLGSTAIGAAPISSTPISSTPISSTKLGALHVTSSKLGSVQLALLTPASAVVNCVTVDCATATLGAAYTASAILPNATLGDPALTPGFAAAGITLNDIVTALLSASDFPWEQLPVQGLQTADSKQPHARYHLTTTVDCAVLSSFRASVTLPAGFFPVAGTSTLSYGGGGPIPASDPAQSPRDVDNPTNSFAWGKLTCQEGFTGSESVQLSFESYAGLKLGRQTASASVAVGRAQIAVSGQAPITVTQNWESNDDPAAAPVVNPDTLLVGHIGGNGDQDFFRLPLSGLPRGTRISVYLSHIPQNADFDLTVASDTFEPFFSSPISSTPISSTPIEDTGLSFDSSGTAIPSETLQDVPISSTPISSTPISSTSTNRGSADEAASFLTNGGETGFATIGISGYNGSSSNDSYVLRVQETPPPTVPPNCPAPTFAFGAPSSFTPGSLPNSLPASTRTLFLLNRQRLSAMYGPTAATQIVNALTTLAGRSEVAGRILPVDGNSAVRDAYAAWDASRCSIAAINNVVSSIQDVIAGYQSDGLPNLRYVVLVGNDNAIPMKRIHDPVSLSPELNEASDLAFTTSNLTQNNPLYASAADNDIVTDNAYAGWVAHPWLDRNLPLPEASVARLLERPADIIGQINRYLGANGISSPQTGIGTLNPSATLTTGYDFLADGANAVAANLNSNFPSAAVVDLFGAHPTISSTWSGDDLRSGFLQAGTPAAIASVNGHYNHYELEAGDGSLASTADASSAVPSRILFTMGCHGGFNIPNTTTGPGAGLFLDWPELYAQKQVAAYIGNTGFGYGDSASIALSERLLSLYAKNIKLYPTIGDAWAASLATYAATTGPPSVYDEKVIGEATFYGLPFWRFTTSPASLPTPTPLPTTPDPVSGTPSAVVTVTPSGLTQANFPDGTTQWNDGGNTAFGLYRPTQPLTTREVTASTPARGLWITALATEDHPGVKPHLGYPTIDLAAHETVPNIAPIFFPASPFTLSHQTVFGIQRDFAGITGQFRPDPATPGRGTERLVRSATLQVLYSNSADTTPPLISEVNVSTSGTTATVLARVTDDSGSLSQVAALVNDGTWHYVPLSQSGSDPTLWTGTATVTQEPEVFVEARDVANVGYSANKGSNFTSATSAPPAGPQILVASPFGTYGQGQQVIAQYSCSSGDCTGTVPSGSPVDTSTPGVHTFIVTSTDADGHTTTLQRDYFIADLRLVLRITPSTVRPPAIVWAYASLSNLASVDRLVSLNATFMVNTSFEWTSRWITVKVPAGRTYAGVIPFPILRRLPKGDYTVILRASDVTGLVTATATLTVQ